MLSVPRPHAGSRGFTLIELMVVVVMVSLLAVLAGPAMLEAQHSRRAYEDAATIMMLFKNARTRAIGDQAAVTIMLTFDNSTLHRGLFSEYESTFANGGLAADPNNVGGQASMSSCTTPSVWNTGGTTSATHPVLVEGYSMEEPTDIDARVHLLVTTGTSVAASSGQFAFCFTPSGRMYTANGGSSGTNPVFTDSTMSPSVFSVKRDNGVTSTTYEGPTRNVLVMPSGATRLYSS